MSVSLGTGLVKDLFHAPLKNQLKNDLSQKRPIDSADALIAAPSSRIDATDAPWLVALVESPLLFKLYQSILSLFYPKKTLFYITI